MDLTTERPAATETEDYELLDFEAAEDTLAIRFPRAPPPPARPPPLAGRRLLPSLLPGPGGAQPQRRLPPSAPWPSRQLHQRYLPCLPTTCLPCTPLPVQPALMLQ